MQTGDEPVNNERGSTIILSVLIGAGFAIAAVGALSLVSDADDLLVRDFRARRAYWNCESAQNVMARYYSRMQNPAIPTSSEIVGGSVLITDATGFVYVNDTTLVAILNVPVAVADTSEAQVRAISPIVGFGSSRIETVQLTKLSGIQMQLTSWAKDADPYFLTRPQAWSSLETVGP